MGLLDLEGQLTRILVSLVSKDSLMLDELDDASIEIKEVNDDPMFMMSMEGVLLRTLTSNISWLLISFSFIVSYDDAACVLRKIFFDAKDPHLSSTTTPILPGRLAMHNRKFVSKDQDKVCQAWLRKYSEAEVVEHAEKLCQVKAIL
ncbi:hypothetical protein BUALT_Bualt03G0007100 [Buddleja alternifolia]|uniref:Uncharacterized protein n=1 Tax=Buddleja alternifolia TaxID=168488 RepID=A0AAV6XSA0_9LAMI|nr:hypothetical protein BUALT_Bualt03G0007100 [Buddleja alternifolia]